MLIQLRRLPVAADAARLIQDLGNPDFSARERATQALIDAGGAVAAQVQQATLSDDPEVAMRAKRIARLLQLGACEAQVRRLMAVRALGELRHVAARPTLEKLAADETDPELALYARRALGELSNPPGPTPPCQIPRRSRAELESDLELLPAASLGVLQVSLAEPLTAPLNAELDFKPFFGKGVPVLEREPRYLAKLIVLVDSLGYARIDTVTASLAHEGAEKPAAVTCVARGKWDRALRAAGSRRLSIRKVAELESAHFQDMPGGAFLRRAIARRLRRPVARVAVEKPDRRRRRAGVAAERANMDTRRTSPARTSSGACCCARNCWARSPGSSRFNI